MASAGALNLDLSGLNLDSLSALYGDVFGTTSNVAQINANAQTAAAQAAAAAANNAQAQQTARTQLITDMIKQEAPIIGAAILLIILLFLILS